MQVLECTCHQDKEASGCLKRLAVKPGVTDAVSVSEGVNGDVEKRACFLVCISRSGILRGLRGETCGNPSDLGIPFTGEVLR